MNFRSAFVLLFLHGTVTATFNLVYSWRAPVAKSSTDLGYFCIGIGTIDNTEWIIIEGEACENGKPGETCEKPKFRVDFSESNLMAFAYELSAMTEMKSTCQSPGAQKVTIIKQTDNPTWLLNRGSAQNVKQYFHNELTTKKDYGSGQLTPARYSKPKAIRRFNMDLPSFPLKIFSNEFYPDGDDGRVRI